MGLLLLIQRSFELLKVHNFLKRELIAFPFCFYSFYGHCKDIVWITTLFHGSQKFSELSCAMKSFKKMAYLLVCPSSLAGGQKNILYLLFFFLVRFFRAFVFKAPVNLNPLFCLFHLYLLSPRDFFCPLLLCDRIRFFKELP